MVKIPSFLRVFLRRDGRVVEGAGLENRICHADAGSNPALSGRMGEQFEI